MNGREKNKRVRYNDEHGSPLADAYVQVWLGALRIGLATLTSGSDDTSSATVGVNRFSSREGILAQRRERVCHRSSSLAAEGYGRIVGAVCLFVETL